MNRQSPPSTHTQGPHLSLGKSIAIAEIVGSAASLGTVWLMGRSPRLIGPAKTFVAERIIYPVISRALPADAPQAEKDRVMKKAQDDASLFLKGVIMVGSGFAMYIPTQMFLEGKHDFGEFKKVIFGKSIGLTTAMGAMALINVLKPGMLEYIEDRMGALLPCDTPKPREHCETNREVCKLVLLDIPSSVVSGLVNFGLTRRL